MRTIQTGKKPLGIDVAAAILSLSLVVNLPGLAVTPMLAQLKQIFPNSSQFEEQLLTLVPNLIIIPFVLLSGKLSLTRHKIGIIVSALILFTLSAVAYFFCNSMTALITASAVLGAGAGLLIPFSTGLLSDCYSGLRLTRQMGYQSGISNLTLVLATFAVGLLASRNWHLPFAVYLAALIPLAMTPLLKKIPLHELNPASVKPGIALGENPLRSGKTWQMMGIYFTVTFLAMSIVLFGPYLIKARGWSDAFTGTVTSVFFLFLFLPGFFIGWILRVLKSRTLVISGLMIAAGLCLTAAVPAKACLVAGAALCGAGYGIFQPLIYDKAAKAVPGRSTQTLAFVLATNYLGIVLTPEIVDMFRSFLPLGPADTFAFRLAGVFSIAFVTLVCVFRRTYGFNLPHSYWADKEN